MRRLSFVLFLILALSSVVVAQSSATPAVEPVPESQRASIDEVKALFESQNAQKQAEDMINMMKRQMLAMFEEEMKKQSPPPTPHQLSLFRTWMDESMSTLNVADMMNDMAVVYQKYLTRDEIVAINAFYASPAGKSMMAKLPTMMTEYMQVALPKQQKKMEALMASLQERVNKEMAAEAKSGTHKN